jgi:hypothetical protein
MTGKSVQHEGKVLRVNVQNLFVVIKEYHDARVKRSKST